MVTTSAVRIEVMDALCRQRTRVLGVEFWNATRDDESLLIIDVRRGRRLGKYDRIFTWHRPARPAWMDVETYETIPETLELRVIRYNVVQPGMRTQQLTVATTLTDADVYTKEDVAELYGFRWNSELDIRSIKQSLHLDHLSCKSPEMVRNELWTTMLGYNLIRTTAAAAALLHDLKPRQISFTGTCQFVLSGWIALSYGWVAPENIAAVCKAKLKSIASCRVANRPGRIEPREIKRRRHNYPLMQESRRNFHQRYNQHNHQV